MRRLVGIVLALAVASCERPSAPVADGTDGAVLAGGGMLSVEGSCSITGRSANPHWAPLYTYACGATIPVDDISSLIGSGDLGAAIAIWNGGLSSSTYGLPTFAVGQGGVTLTDHAGDSGNLVCSEYDRRSRTITIHKGVTAIACGSDHSDPGARAVSVTDHGQLAALVAHELGHALGFHQHYDDNALTGSCVMCVPQEGAFNGGLCHFETQVVWYIYGLTDGYDDPNKDVIQDLVPSPRVLTLAPGGSGQVTVQAIRLLAGGSVQPGTTEAFSYALSGEGAGNFTLSPSGPSVRVTNLGVSARATLSITVTSTLYNGSGFSVQIEVVPTSVVLQVPHAGTGYVTSDPQGIDTRSVSSYSFAYGTIVTLTPHMSSGYSVVWGGSCGGGGACQVTMNGPKSVSATFIAPLSVTITGMGFSILNPVHDQQTCSLRADVAGGVGSVNYVWESSPFGQGAWEMIGLIRVVDVSADSDLDLRVTASDGLGRQATKTSTLHVTPNGAACP